MIQLVLLNAWSRVECGASVDSRWSAYLNLGLRAPHASWRVHVTFQNDAPYPVSLDRVPEPMRTLDERATVSSTLVPGASIKVECTIGDVLTARARDPGAPHDGALLLAHEAQRVHIHNDTSCDHLPLTRCDRPEFTADARWTPPDSFLFSNHLDAAVDLFFVDEAAECEEYVGTAAPFADHHMQSSLGHHFRMRDAQETLIGEYHLRAVSITGLEEEDDRRLSERAGRAVDLLHLEALERSLRATQALADAVHTRLDGEVTMDGTGDGNRAWVCEQQ